MEFDRLRELLADLFDRNPAEITPATTFDELLADELDFVELAWMIQEETGLEPLEGEDLRPIATVGELLLYVKTRQTAQAE
jgi:acyl carrier protein